MTRDQQQRFDDLLTILLDRNRPHTPCERAEYDRLCDMWNEDDQRQNYQRNGQSLAAFV